MRWQQAVLEALEPSSQAAVAAAADGGLSVSRLNSFVTSRVWHSGNPQLHTARRALAEHLVQKANPGDPNQAASTQADAYMTPCPQAGTVMLKAIQAQFSAAVQRCYKSMSQAVDGDRYLSTFISGPSEKSVCLNITQLLQDAAQGLQGQQPEAAGFAAPAAQHSSTAGSSSSTSQRATGCITLQDGPGAAAADAARTSAGAATTPAAVFERTTSSSSAAESAAAALRAAAESLMPPAVSSTASSTPHTPLQAHTAATHTAARPEGSSTAAAAGAGPTLQGSTAAVQEAAVGTVSTCSVRQPPGFPPWLNPLQTARRVSDSQLRSPSNAQLEHPEDDVLKELTALFEAGSNSSTDGSSSSQAPPARQHTAQQQPVQQNQPELSHSPQQASAAAAAAGGASSGAAAAAVLGSCEGADRSSMDVPLHYKLVLQNSATPGWYTAEYVAADATDPSAKPHQASAAGGIQQDSQGGVVGEGAAGPAAAAAAMAATSILQILPDRLHPDLLPHLSRPAGQAPRLSRILISRGQPVTLRFGNRTALTLTTHVTLSEALQQLLAAQQQWNATQQQQHEKEGRPGQSCELPAADTADIGHSDRTSSASSSNGSSSRNDTYHERDVQLANGSSKAEQVPSSSRHNNNSQTLKDQYTAAGGHVVQGQGVSAAVGLDQSKDDSELQRAAARLFSSHSSGCVGIPFSCHRVCAVYDASGAISGLTYCIDTQPPGSAQGLADLLSSMKASLLVQEQQEEDGWTGMDRPHSLLLLGRPGAGKASLLRDICRLMSGRPDAGGLGLDVMLIDTAGHVAGVAAEPCTAIGSARLVSAPVRSYQPQLMVQAALQHQADVLVVAELSTQQDVAAAVYIARSSNVLLVAAAPAAASLKVLLADATLCPLVGCERTVTRDGSSSSCSSQVAIQRMRPSPFACVLEVAAADRLRLHPDVQASVDEMLATQTFAGSSSSQRQQHAVSRSQSRYAPQLRFSQLRTRDAADHWTVDFASPAAAAQGLEAAGLLHSTARSLATPI